MTSISGLKLRFTSQHFKRRQGRFIKEKYFSLNEVILELDLLLPKINIWNIEMDDILGVLLQ